VAITHTLPPLFPPFQTLQRLLTSCRAFKNPYSSVVRGWYHRPIWYHGTKRLTQSHLTATITKTVLSIKCAAALRTRNYDREAYVIFLPHHANRRSILCLGNQVIHRVCGLPCIPTTILQSRVIGITCICHFPHPIQTLVWVLNPGERTREVVPLCRRIRFRILARLSSNPTDNFRGLLIFCGPILG